MACASKAMLNNMEEINCRVETRKTMEAPTPVENKTGGANIAGNQIVFLFRIM